MSFLSKIPVITNCKTMMWETKTENVSVSVIIYNQKLTYNLIHIMALGTSEKSTPILVTHSKLTQESEGKTDTIP